MEAARQDGTRRAWEEEMVSDLEERWSAKLRAEHERCAEAMARLGQVEEQATLVVEAAAAQAEEAMEEAARMKAELSEAQAALTLALATPRREDIPELRSQVQIRSAVVNAVRPFADNAEDAFEETEALLDVLKDIRRRGAPENRSGSGNLRRLIWEDLRTGDDFEELQQELEEVKAKLQDKVKQVASLRWRQTIRGPGKQHAAPAADEKLEDVDSETRLQYESRIKALEEEKEDLEEQVARENREAMVRTTPVCRVQRDTLLIAFVLLCVFL